MNTASNLILSLSKTLLVTNDAHKVLKDVSSEDMQGRTVVLTGDTAIIPPDNWGGPAAYINPRHRSKVNQRVCHVPYKKAQNRDLFAVQPVVGWNDVLEQDMEALITNMSHLLVPDKVSTYSGCYVTRSRNPYSQRVGTGAFALAIRCKLGVKHFKTDRWYNTGVDDVWVSFAVPLHKNNGYIRPGSKRSGDSFCMMFYKGKRPPPIYRGTIEQIKTHLKD